MSDSSNCLFGSACAQEKARARAEKEREPSLLKALTWPLPLESQWERRREKVLLADYIPLKITER